MFSIHSASLLSKLLVFITLIGAITNQLGSTTAYAILFLFVSIILFFNIQHHQLTKQQLLISLFLLLNMCIVFLYQLLIYDFNNLYYIQFFGSQILFFLLFSLFINMSKVYKNIHISFEIIIYLISLFVLVDFGLIELGMNSYQLMYKPEASSYEGKPLGLFGQFSITSSYIIILYMLFLSFNKQKAKSKKIFLFLLLTISIILQDSGTGYLLYAILLLTILYTSNKIKPLAILLTAALTLYLAQSNIVHKISFDYTMFLYDYFLDIFLSVYVNHVYNIFDFLFGINSEYNFPIDFGPLFMIAKVGFLYFILYSCLIFYIIYKSPDIFLRMALISFIIANMHYPVLFYPLANILLPILIIYVENTKKYGIEHAI